MIVVVDMANVLGSRPDGWWRDRAGASKRLLDRLAGLAGTTVTDPDGRPAHIDRMIAVLEGAARSADPPAATGIEVVQADRDADSTIAAMADQLLSTADLLVVTADRGLRQRLPTDTRTAGPDWLNRLIAR